MLPSPQVRENPESADGADIERFTSLCCTKPGLLKPIENLLGGDRL